MEWSGLRRAWAVIVLSHLAAKVEDDAWSHRRLGRKPHQCKPGRFQRALGPTKAN